MSVSTSILEDLLQAIPHLRSQIYFKSSLTALSHAMEDRILAGPPVASQMPPLTIASFQRERFYRQEASRYQRLARITPQVYVFAGQEGNSSREADAAYEFISFDLDDPLGQEWHLVTIDPYYTSCLICRECQEATTETEELEPPPFDIDSSRRFEGIWTFDRATCLKAAELLLDRAADYRPQLGDRVAEAKITYGIATKTRSRSRQKPEIAPSDPEPFVERLVTYLQAGQYKLLKAYRSISAQERKERLVNSISAAVRGSLDPDEVLEIAARELGQALEACRCLIYRCQATDETADIQHEYLGKPVGSLAGQTWPLQDNPLFQAVVRTKERVYLQQTRGKGETKGDRDLLKALQASSLSERLDRWFIGGWLMVPVLYRTELVGMVELHQCGAEPAVWEEDELAMVEAIATRVGVALIQAQTHANLEDLNQQLAALERTRSNLIAITGHELRTPLSTIQICLESLANEPDMDPQLRQVMLDTALSDADRLRELVQDFLTLSRFESGRVEWNIEPLSLVECVELAMSSVRVRRNKDELPNITTKVSPNLPLVRADGEWLVQVLSKIIDNASKFTPANGKVTVSARKKSKKYLEVTIADTGRGIEPSRLEVIFDLFYQEEGALRRTTGGTGLGLAICRQVVERLGGKIWAESEGKDRGSAFHFTIPIV